MDARNHQAKPRIARMVGPTMAIMIKRESNRIVRSCAPTGPTGSSTAGWHAAKARHAAARTLQRTPQPGLRANAVFSTLSTAALAPYAKLGANSLLHALPKMRKTIAVSLLLISFICEDRKMAKTHEAITPELQKFIAAQHMFFVATAPLSAAGHVNMSPKGLDCFYVFGPHQVGYLDLTGSGNETSAHLVENGRVTFMFCAFQGPPRILRLYGAGRVVLPEAGEWAELAPLFPANPGARQIIVADIERVQTSCGFAVPLMQYEGQRDTLVRWAESKGEDELVAYRVEKNSHSIDGLQSPLNQPERNLLADASTE